MTIEKIDIEWANSGTKETTLTDAKKELGWVGADQPEIERFNYLQNRADVAINDIIRERVNSYYDGATDHKLMLSSGQWVNPWGLTSDTANVIAGGATKEYRDLAVSFTSAGDARLMVLDHNTIKIEIYDPRTMALVDTSDVLTDDLPAAGATWEPLNMCTDGTYVYVVLVDTNAAPDVYRVQAWTISDWSVRTGWPATGTALTDTGNVGGQSCEIIVASATMLAVLNKNTTITADTDEIITIMNIATGVIVSEGAGDAPVAVAADPSNGFCSDGTNVYFSVFGSGNGYFCSASIADPTAGCGGANYPSAVFGANHCNSIVACGPDLVVSIWRPAGGYAAADVVIRTHNAVDSDLDTIERGQNAATVPVVADEYLLEFPLGSVFDGINLWILTRVDNKAGHPVDPTPNIAVLKIDVARLSIADTTTVRQLPDITNSLFYISPDTGSNITELFCTVAFDGRDIWAFIETAAAQANSGKLFRLPLALLRS
jgi:hypothetical protein